MINYLLLVVPTTGAGNTALAMSSVLKPVSSGVKHITIVHSASLQSVTTHHAVAAEPLSPYQKCRLHQLCLDRTQSSCVV